MLFSVAPTCAFSARGSGSDTAVNINENTVLVFENVDLNVCGDYDNSTGNITLYCIEKLILTVYFNAV